MRGLADDIITEANAGQITIWGMHDWLEALAEEKRVERGKRTRFGPKREKARVEALKKEEFFYRYIADSLMTARRTDHSVVIEEVAKFLEAWTANDSANSGLADAMRKRFLLKG